jgi:hypothetical protein
MGDHDTADLIEREAEYVADTVILDGKSFRALLSAAREGERLRELTSPAHWKDRPDQWTDAIAAVHPVNSDDPQRFKRFELALEMVGNRHGKYELVGLVQWLLTRLDQTEAALQSETPHDH